MYITGVEELQQVLESKEFDFVNCQTLSSRKPLDCESEPCVLGVDEAGRGPVLGPMVYAVSYVPKKRISDLENIGCADSKTLTEKKREELFSILCACEDYVGWSVNVISPNYISNKMLKRVKYSLNEIAEEATIGLIQNIIDNKINVSEIYVDTVGPPEKYQEKLSNVFTNCKVVVAKKADSLYPIVSAASICAKVIRDTTLRNWKFSETLSFEAANLGSGYPNDPQSKTFLKENVDDIFGYTQLVRFSWSTAEKILDGAAANVEWDEDDADINKKESIKMFFKPMKGRSEQEMKHRFFKLRSLANASTF